MLSGSVRGADADTCNNDAPDEPPWASLPANVLVRVFLKLPLQDLCCCSMVCHCFCNAAQTDSIWKALLQSYYGCSAPVRAAATSKQYMRQLKTASLWTCGSSWPSLRSTGCTSTTTLVKLWSNVRSRIPLPLDAYCSGLAKGFVVTAVAAGKQHLVLLSCDGQVIDTRSPAPAAAAAAIRATDLIPDAPVDHQQPAVADGQAAAAAAALGEVADQPWEQVLAAADAVAGLPDEHLQQQGDEHNPYNQQHHQQLQQQQAGVVQIAVPWRPPETKIATIAAGPGHVLALSGCGGVWGWGSNECGQLGLGHNNSWQSTPANSTQVLDGAWKAAGDVIVSAACGDSHSALLAGSGAVYTAGCNKQGQCAQGIMLQMCPVFSQPMQEGIVAAAGACGAANTVLATASGRLLVCGDSSCGQCGAAHIKQGCCHEFIDLGPEVTWHGLNRPTPAQVTAVGGSVIDALPKVTQVAAGCGTCYAVTEEGEVFAWGAGSKGQLGRGGCTKVQATPAKLPWAKHITHVSASLDGAFAAAVDETGVLYTWGAGKWGQLGHGDTSKRTVGRAVKQLKNQTVLQAVCGSESLLVLTCNRPCGDRGTNRHPQSPQEVGSTADAGGSVGLRSSSGVSLDRTLRIRSAAGSSSSRHGGSGSGVTPSDPGSLDVCGSSSCELLCMDGVDWIDVEGQGPFYCPRPRSGYARKGLRGAKQAAAAAAVAPATREDELEGSHLSVSAPAANSDPAVSHSFMGSSGIHRTYSSASSNSSSSGSKPFNSRRFRYHRTTASPAGSSADAQHASTAIAATVELDDQEGIGSQTSEGGLPGKCRERMDKGFRRLLKRLLKQFVSDNKQRELEFPASLSSADRYHIHVAADAWGLGHSSHTNESGDRIIKVWKVSRARRMMSGADVGFGSD